MIWGMTLALLEANKSDRTVLGRLIELYRYDFSEFDGSDVGPHGDYGYRYLDHYWTEPGRYPFLFQVDGKWAGFALVREIPPYDMAEFFVMRKFRRVGIGQQAAAELFAKFPGPWQVRQLLSNPAATAFWRRAIRYAYSESATEEEVIQEFISGTE
jgi:predicted acetyltransferase